jgi:hypothetical protein
MYAKFLNSEINKIAEVVFSEQETWINKGVVVYRLHFCSDTAAWNA